MSYTILSGGVGGAKLVAGFDALLDGAELRVIANTADDFVHLGLNISPDIDTLMYTLAGIANPATGWGIVDETFASMAALDKLGGEIWFRLGDKDLATHLQRTTLLQQGKSLSEVTTLLCAAFGLSTRIIPMSNDNVATRVHTDEGVLAFQDYFVRRRAEPAVSRLVYAGADTAKIAAGARNALSRDNLKAI
jgi:LPPG:FO 2-phospho-L-lactate transferase